MVILSQSYEFASPRCLFFNRFMMRLRHQTVFNIVHLDLDIVMMNQHLHHGSHLEPPLILGPPVGEVCLLPEVLHRPKVVVALLDSKQHGAVLVLGDHFTVVQVGFRFLRKVSHIRSRG